MLFIILMFNTRGHPRCYNRMMLQNWGKPMVVEETPEDEDAAAWVRDLARAKNP